MAEESVILLKNEDNLLPLDPKKSGRILVVGPNAASVHLGGYSPKPFVGVSLIILAVGGNEATAREAYFAGDSRGDRDDIDLFGQQNELAAALLELGKPVITVLIHGRPLSPQLIAAKCPAILDAFYPGEEGGLNAAIPVRSWPKLYKL